MKPLLRGLILALLVFILSGCAGWQNGLFEHLMAFERGRADLEAQTQNTGQRVTAYLERTGQPGGETIVLLHGFSANKDNWVRFIRYLPDTYRVLAVDMPGHGESTQNPDKSYTTTDILKRLSADLAALVPEKFHLAGNSLGGLVASRYALANPDRVISLGLFNAAGVTSPTPSKLQRMVARGDNFLLPHTRAQFDRLMALSFYDPPFLPWPAKAVMARQYLDNYAFNKKMWQDLHHRQNALDISARLKELRLPTLVLWGDADNLLHVSSVQVFQAHLPQARTVILKDCGHVPMAERPADTAAHYRRFLESLPESRP